jgi:predicted ATP-grasp superfamily ATP-dependent carboligase
VEVSLLIRIQNLRELADWVKMLQVFPAFGKGLNLEQNIDGLQKKAEELKAEVQKLEKQKASLVQSPATVLTTTA